jgi:hypothetical protein
VPGCRAATDRIEPFANITEGVNGSQAELAEAGAATEPPQLRQRSRRQTHSSTVCLLLCRRPTLESEAPDTTRGPFQHYVPTREVAPSDDADL